MKRFQSNNHECCSYESDRKKIKYASMRDDILVQKLNSLKKEYSDRMIKKLNNLPDEIIDLILSFHYLIEVFSLGNLLFYKRWSQSIFHNSKLWKKMWSRLVEVDFELNISQHQHYFF